MNIIDVDAHPPIDEKKREEFYKTLSLLGITRALGAPLEEGMTKKESNLLAIRNFNCRSMWGHPDCADTLEGASLLTVDSAWLPEAEEILRIAESKRIPVLLRNENESQIRALAREYPSLPLIVGGSGSRVAKPSLAYELMRDLPQVYLNLSGAVWTYNYVLHEWIQRLPTHRLLFGTDYPYANPASKLAALRWELRHTAASVTEAILGGNALDLLKEAFV